MHFFSFADNLVQPDYMGFVMSGVALTAGECRTPGGPYDGLMISISPYYILGVVTSPDGLITSPTWMKPRLIGFSREMRYSMLLETSLKRKNKVEVQKSASICEEWAVCGRYGLKECSTDLALCFYNIVRFMMDSLKKR